jgi:hypothetical protein
LRRISVKTSWLPGIGTTSISDVDWLTVAYSFASSASLVSVRLHQGYAALFTSSIHDFRQYFGSGFAHAVSPERGMELHGLKSKEGEIRDWPGRPSGLPA